MIDTFTFVLHIYIYYNTLYELHNREKKNSEHILFPSYILYNNLHVSIMRIKYSTDVSGNFLRFKRIITRVIWCRFFECMCVCIYIRI